MADILIFHYWPMVGMLINGTDIANQSRYSFLSESVGLRLFLHIIRVSPSELELNPICLVGGID